MNNKPIPEKEADAMIDMGKELVREARKELLLKLNDLISKFSTKFGILSSEAREKNWKISAIHRDTDTQDLYFLGKKIAVLDWVEMEIYQVKEEKDGS